MIKFEHNDGDLKKAVFGGTITDLVADICLQCTLIYGAMKNQDEKIANEFRKSLIIALTDPDVSGKVFSTDVYDSIKKSDKRLSGLVSGDESKIIEQIMELLK